MLLTASRTLVERVVFSLAPIGIAGTTMHVLYRPAGTSAPWAAGDGAGGDRHQRRHRRPDLGRELRLPPAADPARLPGLAGRQRHGPLRRRPHRRAGGAGQPHPRRRRRPGAAPLGPAGRPGRAVRRLDPVSPHARPWPTSPGPIPSPSAGRSTATRATSTCRSRPAPTWPGPTTASATSATSVSVTTKQASVLAFSPVDELVEDPAFLGQPRRHRDPGRRAPAALRRLRHRRRHRRAVRLGPGRRRHRQRRHLPLLAPAWTSAASSGCG